MVTCKETRAFIIALHKIGFTGKDIAASKIALKSTIYQELQGERFNCCEEGFRTPKKVQQAPGPSPKVDSAAGSGHHHTELAQEWQQAGVSASACTVSQIPFEDGLVSRRTAKKPLLSRKNIRDRLIFCKRYRDWTAKDWGKVIFSDESPFRLFGASGKKLARDDKVCATISPVSCQQ